LRNCCWRIGDLFELGVVDVAIWLMCGANPAQLAHEREARIVSWRISAGEAAMRMCAPIRHEGTGASRVFRTLSAPKAPPPLGEPWTCVTATRPNTFDRRALFEVLKPPLRD